MSGFKSFSQKTTSDENTKQVQANEHSQVNSSAETKPDNAPSPEAEQTEHSEKADPNNK
ncbi:hypothetical protein [Acinetobacter sp. NIPH 2699]|uniref:hypothetical protein n=1 Tax=Acinetobacter sp. NIPH 2699 TaxID=2923433 RepID=UPI001F4A3403|nr:hypothetical protein [Acinetobacter sp. NIPH 2699]MCH7337227.1 hypothetical protein [Acinetobacter sp. NIPH 2699]